MFQKILVAIDESDTHRTVFESALTLAKVTNAHLILMHVLSLNNPNTLALPMFSGYYPTVNEELVKQLQAEQQALTNRGIELLQSLVDEAMTAGVTAKYMHITGDPSHLICATANDLGVDLIAIGRRGRSGLRELFLGSVSNYVVHHAPCSVLVIQSQAEPERAVLEETTAI
jgi:nucleotide-binding universal stress UspA family protein